jgi:hypothetical protein
LVGAVVLTDNPTVEGFAGGNLIISPQIRHSKSSNSPSNVSFVPQEGQLILVFSIIDPLVLQWKSESKLYFNII